MAHSSDSDVHGLEDSIHKLELNHVAPVHSVQTRISQLEAVVLNRKAMYNITHDIQALIRLQKTCRTITPLSNQLLDDVCDQLLQRKPMHGKSHLQQLYAVYAFHVIQIDASEKHLTILESSMTEENDAIVRQAGFDGIKKFMSFQLPEEIKFKLYMLQYRLFTDPLFSDDAKTSFACIRDPSYIRNLVASSNDQVVHQCMRILEQLPSAGMFRSSLYDLIYSNSHLFVVRRLAGSNRIWFSRYLLVRSYESSLQRRQ